MIWKCSQNAAIPDKHLFYSSNPAVRISLTYPEMKTTLIFFRIISFETIVYKPYILIISPKENSFFLQFSSLFTHYVGLADYTSLPANEY